MPKVLLLKIITLLNNAWVKKETTGEIRKYFKLNDYKNMIHQNL